MTWVPPQWIPSLPQEPAGLAQPESYSLHSHTTQHTHELGKGMGVKELDDDWHLEAVATALSSSSMLKSPALSRMVSTINSISVILDEKARVSFSTVKLRRKGWWSEMRWDEMRWESWRSQDNGVWGVVAGGWGVPLDSKGWCVTTTRASIEPISDLKNNQKNLSKRITLADLKEVKHQSVSHYCNSS